MRAGVIIFAAIEEKSISSDRESVTRPRRPATNGGPRLWHRSDEGPVAAARARKVLEARNKKKEWMEKCGSMRTAKSRGATRGLPRRSPILVLLSPKHA